MTPQGQQRVARQAFGGEGGGQGRRRPVQRLNEIKGYSGAKTNGAATAAPAAAPAASSRRLGSDNLFCDGAAFAAPFYK